MYRIVLLSLLSLATAVPVFVTQDDMNYMMHIFGAYYPIDRSDQEGVSTSSGGNYGTSGYAGGDLGGSYGDGGLDNGSGGHLESSGDQYNGGHQDRFTPISSSYTSGFDAGHGGDDGGHAVSLEGNHNYVHSVPISEHIEVTKPVAVPVYKHVGVPVPKTVPIVVPHPVAIGVPQPYPVHIPVPKHVPIQVIKTVAIPVEKKVPYPVEKHIPVPVEKPVPITIEKHIPVPVVKPYPIKIPIYKTIYHHVKKAH